MATLTTKLLVPPLRARLVPRPQLTARLEEAAASGVPLSLVCAPPGFGKTALVSEWLHGSGRTAAWLTLDGGDNDPARFLAYLTAALERLDARLGGAAGELLRSPRAPSPTLVLAQLVNDVTASGLAPTLVLDDYHLITSDAVHDVLRLLLERVPPGMNVVVITRHDPPLGVARLRARGQLLEVREGALRFGLDDTAEFLASCMGLSLPAEAVATLAARTEGWVAGVQLAALALLNRPGAAGEVIEAFGGKDRYVVDYLVSEVLQGLPAHLRDFLRRTALLERLSAPLCDFVRERADSQELLEELEGRNLFIVALDNHREWFRYHGLFAEFLASGLSAGERSALHERAAGWLAREGHTGEAVRHALASGNAGLGGRLVAEAADATLHSGAVLTLAAWLEALPPGLVREDGRLAAYQAWALTLTGRPAEAADHLDAAEELLRAGGDPIELAKALTLRAFTLVLEGRDYPAASRAAGEALDLLDDALARWRVIALWALAEARERTAPLAEAITAVREARAVARGLGNQVFAPAIDGMLAADLNQHGERREALAVCREALERYCGAGGRLLPLAGLIASRRGMLHYEADELPEAREWLERGLELSRSLEVGAQLSFSLGALAPTLHALGERERAIKSLREAYELSLATSLADPGWLLAVEAELRLRDGEVAAAAEWARAASLSADESPQYLRLEPLVVFARLLLAQGKLHDARRLLARLERFSFERGFRRQLITVHALQALAADAWGDRAAALELAARALRLAAPEGYKRAIIDEGGRFIALARAAREAAPDFAAELSGGPAAASPTALPPEALTAREGEILALIAAGLGNAEIAGELGIAVATVKRHINGLYGKLGADTRTRAVARARELGLLADGITVRS